MSDDEQPAPSNRRKKPVRPLPPKRPQSAPPNQRQESSPPSNTQTRPIRLKIPVNLQPKNPALRATPPRKSTPSTNDERSSTTGSLRLQRSARFNIPKEKVERVSENDSDSLKDDNDSAKKSQRTSERIMSFLQRRKRSTIDDTGSRRASWRRPNLERLNPNVRVKSSRILYTTDEEVRDALMEFAVFIVFLILTSMVTLSVRHSYMFYFNDTMKNLFTTREMVVAPLVTVCFEKLITVPDWWDYLIFNFLVILHGDMSVINPDETHEGGYYYPSENETHKLRYKRDNGEQVGRDIDYDYEEFTADKARARPHNRTHLQGRVFLHENLLLGPPRLRQIRVRKDSCFVNDAFIRYFNTCYDSYSAGAEEIKPEHGGAPFKTKKELDSTTIWTVLNTYDTGGYTVDLTYDKETNLQIIKGLRDNHWIDRGSRLCLIEFNLYNENTDIFQMAKFIAEIPPTGGVLPQSHLQTVKHFSFITDTSLLMNVVYIFWYIMVVYYNINEISEIKKSGFRKYFKGILNILDSIILLFCYLALGYNIWHTFKVKRLISTAKVEETYISLDVLCLVNIIYVDMMAVLAFLVWIKIFKFISFNKTLVQFTTTLKRCSKDLAGFSLMFGIVFLAYAQLGLLLFGTKHPDFRNFITSILTMIRMILGDFQYNLIEQANRVLGPIYFLTYILLVFFILLNMFLAIIMETYNTVKSEITQGRSQLGSYVYKKLSAAFYFITHCGRKRRNRDTVDPEPEFQDFTDDPTSTSRFEQSKHHLRRNMSEAEVKFFEDVPSNVNNKDMFRLSNRVALLEEILEQLVTNMDVILKRVEKEIKKHK